MSLLRASRYPVDYTSHRDSRPGCPAERSSAAWRSPDSRGRPSLRDFFTA